MRGKEMKGQMEPGKMGLYVTLLAFFVGIMIIFAVGVNINQNVRNNVYEATQTITNQTITIDNTTNNTAIFLISGRVNSITTVSNQTLVFTSGNYSIQHGDISDSILVTLSCASCKNFAAGQGSGNALNVTYSVSPEGTAFNAVQNATVGINNNQSGSIGTVIGASIVIMIIFGVIFMITRGRREE